jgi:3-deoxy-manno-octulosonate cytidylyltransferase (CMP-KDO synthetase)
MKTIILIPARYASSRYPGKPLVMLKDREGNSKSLIQRSWECAMAVRDVDAVYVATDDDRIKDAAEAFGAKVVMTSEDCANGTERCADAMKNLGESADIVINLQGDAPLTPSWFVEALIEEMKTHPDVQMATPVLRCDAETYANFVEDRHNGRVGGTTAVFDSKMNALYFSKEVLPYTGRSFGPKETIPVFHHVGVYGYRESALSAYMGWQAGPLEKHEGLEQLRFLENGMPIRCVQVDGRGRVFWELNNPVDVARIESVI